MLQRSRGYSVIELIIAVSIVGLLATVGIYNYAKQRQNARDAYRQATIRTYASAMEQYYAQHRTYMVVPSGCTMSTGATSYYSGGPRMPVGAPLSACLGLNGGAWGSLHRKDASISYGNQSLAEYLRNNGYLNTIAMEPRAAGVAPADSASGYRATYALRRSFNDFVLVLCTLDGQGASNINEATAYSVYATLERLNSGSTRPVLASVSSKFDCGKASPPYPDPAAPYIWEILQ